MRKIIEECIEYLKKLSIKEPIDIRVEEVLGGKIVLSYEEKYDYSFQNDRIYKEFEYHLVEDRILVDSMKIFKTN